MRACGRHSTLYAENRQENMQFRADFLPNDAGGRMCRRGRLGLSGDGERAEGGGCPGENAGARGGRTARLRERASRRRRPGLGVSVQGADAVGIDDVSVGAACEKGGEKKWLEN